MVQLSSELDSYWIQMKNVTEVNIFILVGFKDDLEVQVYLFLLFLAIYLFTQVGNLGLVMLVLVDSQIQNPMYYFLTVLSFLGACYSSMVTPKMLINFLSENKTISFLRCAAKMLLFFTFGTTECFLLSAMVYDHYVAIYDPPPVFSQHGSQSLRATHHCFLCWWHRACFCTHSGYFQPLLLCLQ